MTWLIAAPDRSSTVSTAKLAPCASSRTPGSTAPTGSALRVAEVAQLVLADPLGEGARDLHRQRRGLLAEVEERAIRDHEHVERRQRGHGRDPRDLREERNLADEAPGPERLHLAPLATHLDLAADDHEELAAALALADQNLALLQVELVRDPRDLLQLLLRALLEER